MASDMQCLGLQTWFLIINVVMAENTAIFRENKRIACRTIGW